MYHPVFYTICFSGFLYEIIISITLFQKLRFYELCNDDDDVKLKFSRLRTNPRKEK